jgi:Cyclopropane fatty acid synthase and related methyltransferases
MLNKFVSRLLRKNIPIQTPSLNKVAKNRILERYVNRPLPELSYATVKDFCDSADHLRYVMRMDGDLKDVQRAWMIKAILGQIPIGGNLLEIGGGEPIVSNGLQELGYNVTIIDPYDGAGNGPRLYEHFKKLYPKIRIIKSYFEKNSPVLENENFDCIFSVSVLEHIPHEKLPDLFGGIASYLKNGGRSIHCIDHVVAGFSTEWARKGIIEMLGGQYTVQHPSWQASAIHEAVEETYELFFSELLADIETYYHSALGHNLWRTGLGLPYEQFPFRKIVSVQTCATKSNFIAPS